MNTLIIRFDGGCRPTNPGNKYGSYMVETSTGSLVHESREFELGWGTNNEAEFESLLEALKWICEETAFSPSSYTLVMFTDSTILLNRINGNNTTCKSEPQKRMAKLTAACMEYLNRFQEFLVTWESREANVAVFGH